MLNEISLSTALDAAVPITRFNRGEANKIFDELHKNGCMVVVKNNKPACVMLTPDRFRYMTEMINKQEFLAVAEARVPYKSEIIHLFDNKEKPTYTIIAGVNGVGKSSFTGVLKKERSDLGFVIDVDKIAHERSCTAIESGKIAINKINKCLQDMVSFSQETTLSGHRTAATIKEAKEKGYNIRLFYIALNSQSELLARIENRVRKGGHNIQEDDVERRFEKRFEDLIKILPFCDEASLFDNENGFVHVGEYRNGELLSIGEYKPLWVDELKDKSF
ncbi:MAG: zeta toxin family protein [Oscillospiraceae bacterium]|nr:zeta toxin family protein [Oscillospiraceae bacterium]